MYSAIVEIRVRHLESPHGEKNILYSQETITLCFKWVIFGLMYSLFLLNGVMKRTLTKVLQLLENLYVDDSSNSFNGIKKQCLEFYEKSKNV